MGGKTRPPSLPSGDPRRGGTSPNLPCLGEWAGLGDVRAGACPGGLCSWRSERPAASPRVPGSRSSSQGWWRWRRGRPVLSRPPARPRCRGPRCWLGAPSLPDQPRPSRPRRRVHAAAVSASGRPVGGQGCGKGGWVPSGLRPARGRRAHVAAAEALGMARRAVCLQTGGLGRRGWSPPRGSAGGRAGGLADRASRHVLLFPPPADPPERHGQTTAGREPR